ncbi:protein kinase C delta type-like [Pyxicephalus adspersus]|uniref:protein kinase C delta type-like n=1 Tax=Pyxicephalus adspersus TaxID=30357 RepID=UPI003B59D425
MRNKELAGTLVYIALEPHPSTHEDGEKPRRSNTCHRAGTVALSAQKFNFHGILGKGAFGKVMVATDRMQRKQVAIKIIKKRKMRDSIYRTLMAEHNIIQLANQCPFLIHGYAAFQTHNYIYYIMELARGGTLRRLIRYPEPKIKSKEVRFIAAELVCGVQFLHSKDIIHGDLKPENILLTDDGHAKISDFGVSIENASTVMKKGRIGTPRYAAPEVWKGEEYDQGIDWFSVGVLLFEMFNRIGPRIGPSFEGLSRNKANILKKLLRHGPARRLGVRGNIRKHRFFKGINWEKLESGKMPSPLTISTNVLDYQLTIKNKVPNKEANKTPLDQLQQQAYKDIGFICPAWAARYHILPMQPDFLPRREIVRYETSFLHCPGEKE